MCVCNIVLHTGVNTRHAQRPCAARLKRLRTYFFFLSFIFCFCCFSLAAFVLPTTSLCYFLLYFLFFCFSFFFFCYQHQAIAQLTRCCLQNYAKKLHLRLGVCVCVDYKMKKKLDMIKIIYDYVCVCSCCSLSSAALSSLFLPLSQNAVHKQSEAPKTRLQKMLPLGVFMTYKYVMRKYDTCVCVCVAGACVCVGVCIRSNFIHEQHN